MRKIIQIIRIVNAAVEWEKSKAWSLRDVREAEKELTKAVQAYMDTK